MAFATKPPDRKLISRIRNYDDTPNRQKLFIAHLNLIRLRPSARTPVCGAGKLGAAPGAGTISGGLKCGSTSNSYIVPELLHCEYKNLFRRVHIKHGRDLQDFKFPWE
jgi:hypothetical protein